MSRETSSDPSWYVIDHSTVSNFSSNKERSYNLFQNLSKYANVTKITEASGQSLSGQVYLGRPWRVLARVMYQYSTLTDVVNSKGWTTMADGATP